jgi:hypothetical protein
MLKELWLILEVELFQREFLFYSGLPFLYILDERDVSFLLLKKL